MDTKKDIYYTKKILSEWMGFKTSMCFEDISNKSTKMFGTYSMVYPFTNDCLKDFSKHVKSDGNVLCVASSGDHALWAILHGAKKVTTFDINILSYYYQALKIAAIRALTYEEFIKFFGILDGCYPIILDDVMFSKIVSYLEYDTKQYWEEIYNFLKVSNRCLADLFSSIFSPEENEYLQKNNYYLLKENLLNIKEVPFIYGDITNIPRKKLGKSKDVILLSNILRYSNGIDDEFISKINDCLAPNGVAQLTHLKLNYYNNRKDYINTYFTNLFFKAATHSYQVYYTKRSITGCLKKKG